MRKRTKCSVGVCAAGFCIGMTFWCSAGDLYVGPLPGVGPSAAWIPWPSQAAVHEDPGVESVLEAVLAGPVLVWMWHFVGVPSF